MTKAIWENRDAVAKTISDFGGLSPDGATPPGLPIHPGAMKFWNELRSSK